MDKVNGFSKKTILLVNTGSTKKKFIIQKLKKMDLVVVVLNSEKNWAQPYVDHWIIADNSNHREAILAVEQFIKNNPQIKIDGVLTFWEDDVLLTAKIVDKFNFIGIPFDIAKQARNKFLFREFCQKNGIKAPGYKLITSKKDLQEITDQFKFPMVIKPAYGSSSAYVVKVETQEELLNTYEYIHKNISADIESALADGLDIIVEEYLDGDEVDIDILLQNGKIKFYSISDNYNKNKDAFFIDSGQAIPSSLPVKSQQELIELAEEILEKMGVLNGCIHFEGKSTPKGAYPIEMNLRMGGDYVYSYTKSAWNVDLIENAVKIATGQFIKIKIPDSPYKYIVGWDLHPDLSGILVELEVDEKLKDRKYLEEINIYKQIGDAVLVPPEGNEQLGWLTVSGYNILDAQDNLKDALRNIDYKVVKFDSDSSLGKTLRKNRFSAAVLNKNLLIRAAKIERVKRISDVDLKNLHIGVAVNFIEDNTTAVSNVTTPVGKIIIQTLRERGYKVSFFDFNNLNKAFNDLRNSNVDLVINVCDYINNSHALKIDVPAILDALQIPYTGCDSYTLALCRDKINVKKLLSYHDIPTPSWDFVYKYNDPIAEDLQYPLIIKPGNNDDSIGIDNQSVVTNKEQLTQQLKKVIEAYGAPVMIEEYIEGDEYDVCVLGNNVEEIQVLPLGRSIFDNLPADYWHIYSYEAKHPVPNSVYEKIIFQQPIKNVSKKLETLISEIALDTYNIIDCQDYGVVQIKVDKFDNPYVLELNPNPALGSRSLMTNSAKLIGMNYGDLIEILIGIAIKRFKKRLVNINL